jgi:hypothetical protein
VVAVVSLGTQAVVWCLVREEHRGHEARVFGTDLPDVKITLDSLGYGRSDKALLCQSIGRKIRRRVRRLEKLSMPR